MNLNNFCTIMSFVGLFFKEERCSTKQPIEDMHNYPRINSAARTVMSELVPKVRNVYHAPEES